MAFQSKKISEFPKWFVGPDNERKVFDKASDVPEDWHAQGEVPPVEGAKAAKAKLEGISLSRAEICAELDKRDVPYKQNAGTAALFQLLQAERALDTE